MQIFFIRNKIKRRKLVNIDEDLLEKEKNNIKQKTNIKSENIRIVLTVFLCEIIGILFVTYVSRNHIFDIEIYKMYFLKKINYQNINQEKYSIYLFTQYLKEIVLIEALNFTRYKKIVNYLYLVYKTITLSISLGIFLLIYGVEGQLKFILTLLPHGIIFYGYIFIFIRNCFKYNIIFCKKHIGKIIMYTFLAIIISFITAFLESKFNLKIIYHLTLV